MPFWSVNTAVWLVLILIFGIKKGTVIQNLAILGDDRLMLCDATGIKKNKDLMRRRRQRRQDLDIIGDHCRMLSDAQGINNMD